MINWRVRFKNPVWVVATLSQLFILAEIILIGMHQAGLTNFQLTKELEDWVFAVVNAIFAVLATLGIVQDPTTRGLEDSHLAKQYNSPK